MDLSTFLLDGAALIGLVGLVALLVGGLALSVADLSGRDLADGPVRRRRSGAAPTPTSPSFVGAHR